MRTERPSRRHDKASVARVARQVQPALSNPNVDRWISDSIAAGRLQRVVRGTYLNRLVNPAALACEAAVWLRPGAERDRLDPQLSYRRATPEAALLHWLCLARSPRSRMSPPPADLDMEALDSRRLKRLAHAMGLSAAVRDMLPLVV